MLFHIHQNEKRQEKMQVQTRLIKGVYQSTEVCFYQLTIPLQSKFCPKHRAVHRSRSTGAPVHFAGAEAGVGKLQQKLRQTKLWKVNINVSSCSSWVPLICYVVSKIPYCLFCLLLISLFLMQKSADPDVFFL